MEKGKKACTNLLTASIPLRDYENLYSGGIRSDSFAWYSLLYGTIYHLYIANIGLSWNSWFIYKFSWAGHETYPSSLSCPQMQQDCSVGRPGHFPHQWAVMPWEWNGALHVTRGSAYCQQSRFIIASCCVWHSWTCQLNHLHYMCTCPDHFSSSSSASSLILGTLQNSEHPADATMPAARVALQSDHGSNWSIYAKSGFIPYSSTGQLRWAKNLVFLVLYRGKRKALELEMFSSVTFTSNISHLICRLLMSPITMAPISYLLEIKQQNRLCYNCCFAKNMPNSQKHSFEIILNFIF